MMNHTMPGRRLGGWAAAALALGLLLGGCVQAPKPLYGWGSYQSQVYAHLKNQEGADPQAQIEALEADFQRMRASGATPPPGFHAHLGLLYNAIGKDEQALQQFTTEKALFPESAHYIDFLLAQAKAPK
jgi:hypothetical protein